MTDDSDPIAQALIVERNKNRERLTNALEKLGLFIQVEDTKDNRVFRYQNLLFIKYHAYDLIVKYHVNSGKRMFYIKDRSIATVQDFKRALDESARFEPTYVTVFGNVKDRRFSYGGRTY